ncbi:MAG: hypothetical protein Ct9H90mP16_08430 [Candidatus Poseidoniales archaeon]|nr:MAG: hypothetical protein Ct9H90mP16_08430 [Candidatus Poseidoniales archaeon]
MHPWISGGFGGLIEFGDNLLALATDGVGSKLQIASMMGHWSGVGIDCMAMNVNDYSVWGRTDCLRRLHRGFPQNPILSNMPRLEPASLKPALSHALLGRGETASSGKL